MTDKRDNKFETAFSQDPRQTIPDPGPYNEESYHVAGQPKGEKERLAEGTGDEGIRDDEYYSLSSGGDRNKDMNFNAVAPYKYPEFGSWPDTERGFKIAGSEIID
jgi:hypothetical protein